MTMRLILARIDGTDGDRAVLEGALRVARQFQSHIEVLHVRFDPRALPLVTGYGAVSDLAALIETLERTADRMAAQARENFQAWRDASGVPLADRRADDGGVSVHWQEVEEREGEEIIRRGRLSDLIVIARPTVETGLSSLVALEAALFDTSRPVLMTPPVLRLGPFGRAIVAWNGSAPAALAVAHGLPLLAASEDVGVFTAVEPKHRGEADELIAYLEWQAIKAGRVAADPATGSVGADLLSTAEATGAGLIVMGAYTRGRARQIVFGGVTRHVVEHAALPVLMAH